VPHCLAAGERKRGFVLPIVIFALAIMGVLVAAGATMTQDDRQGSLSVQEGTRSFYAAEAGLNSVVANWSAKQYDTLVVAAGSNADLGWQILPENGSKYRAVVQRLAPGTHPPFLLTVDGQSAAPRGGLRTISVLLQAKPTFSYGAFGRTGVTMSGGAKIDSYNSDSSAYNPATAGANGDVGSNGDIVLNGGPTRVAGDAAAGGSVSDPSKVTGTSTNLAPVVTFPTMTCPGGGYTPASGIPEGPGISYNAATGDLSVTAGRDLTLPVPPASYHFHDVTLTGNATLTINPGSRHVDLYISNTLSASGGAIANGITSPTTLTIWGCGPSTTDWALSGGTGSYFAVYAPDHPLAITGNSSLYGALIGASITNTGGAKIHFDEALLRSSSNLKVVPGSWTETSR